MSTLQAELSRLFHPGAQGLITPDGRVRALVLELARPADWNAMSCVWRGVQTDLGLPAPAIAVSGVDAYQLWFSLAEPVQVAQAQAFLESLRLRYLGTVAPERIGILPVADTSAAQGFRQASMVPALQQATGRWSAFVAPDLAAIFSDEPWLELPPGADAQASVLSRLECIKPVMFQTILDQIKATVTKTTLPAMPDAVTAAHGKHLDPRQFLQDVLNDESIALHLRIEAAKALLPSRISASPLSLPAISPSVNLGSCG